MEFLSEDPTYLAGALALIGGAFLIALRVSQQGKYLLWALAAFGLAGVVVGVEHVWVTDNERVEQAVYDLGRAVARSDADAALAMMTPDVQYVVRGRTLLSGAAARGMVARVLPEAKFDFLRITHLHANAGGQSRRGSAEFRVIASGGYQGPVNQLNFGSINSSWSLGFRETSPGVWKVNRITPVSIPGGQSVIPTGWLAPLPRQRRPGPVAALPSRPGRRVSDGLIVGPPSDLDSPAPPDGAVAIP